MTERMLLSEYLTMAKPNKHENSTLFLKQIEGWIRLSRTDAAQQCAMNPASITVLSNELMREGLIQECGQALTASGRKPIYLELVPTAGASAAVLLEETYSRLTIHNLHHEIIASTLLAPLSADNAAALRDAIVANVENYLARGLLGLCMIRGDDAPQDEALLETLFTSLRASLPVPVYAAGAVSLCCLSEGHMHYPDTHTCVACLSVTAYQVRIGVMYGDQLLFNHFLSGGIGYTISANGRPPTPLKDKVNLNSIVTGALGYCMAHPDAPFSPEELLREDQPYLAILHLALAGDPTACRLVDNYAADLAVLIYNTACQYGPSLLVVQHQVLSVLEAAGTRIEKDLDRLFASGQARPKIIASQLGPIAPFYGASRLVLRSALGGAIQPRRVEM